MLLGRCPNGGPSHRLLNSPAEAGKGREDMKTLILYCSKSHGNTKKLVDAIVAAHPEVDTIDATKLGKDELPDFSKYELIGLASGIYYAKFDKSVTNTAAKCLRDGDFVFALMTYGGRNEGYTQSINDVCRLYRATYVGGYGCNGYNTSGPFKLVGGIGEKHPTEAEVQGAVDFYDELVKRYGKAIKEQRAKRDAQDAYNAEHPKKTISSTVKGAVGKVASMFGKKDQGAKDGAKKGEAEAGSEAETEPEEPKAGVAMTEAEMVAAAVAAGEAAAEDPAAVAEAKTEEPAEAEAAAEDAPEAEAAKGQGASEQEGAAAVKVAKAAGEAAAVEEVEVAAGASAAEAAADDAAAQDGTRAVEAAAEDVGAECEAQAAEGAVEDGFEPDAEPAEPEVAAKTTADAEAKADVADGEAAGDATDDAAAQD